jgi:3-oxoacyl-[acyl-carrier protein] reductase
MRVDMRGQVALVTGAARGIGRAIADRLAREGADVIYSDIEAPTAAVTEPRHEALALDVTSEAQIAAALEKILGRYGKLDILVNNAGIGAGPEELGEVSAERWERVLRVDLTGVFLMSRAAAAPMMARKSGRIINISSVVGLVPLRLQSAYVAAKAGVVNLTRSMALELAPHGILVNAIAPGSTQSASGEQQAMYARLLSHVPLGRPAKPEEIAHAALFLAAPDSSYVTGHVLTVDGGWTAGYARDF